MGAAGPRGCFVVDLDNLHGAGDVYLEFHVTREGLPALVGRRWVGPPSPNVEEKLAALRQFLVDAIVRIGPGITQVELERLTTEWSDGKLDIQ